MKKRACFIQMHYTDITDNLKRYNPLEKIKNSELFDEVVIAAADVKENKVLEEWAAFWQVKIRFGNKENVLARFLSIAEELSVSTVLRIIPTWYFLDINYVKTLILELENHREDYGSNCTLHFDGEYATPYQFGQIHQHTKRLQKKHAAGPHARQSLD